MLKKYFYSILITLSASGVCLADPTAELQELRSETEMLQCDICDQFLANPDISEETKKKVIKKLRKISAKVKKPEENRP